MTMTFAGACVVCGHRDARGLSSLSLATGEQVVVCGTHALVHRRIGAGAQTLDELRATVRERRTSRRRGADVDELGAELSRAFAGGERRAPGDRRG